MAVDWTEGIRETYRFYAVDVATWHDYLEIVDVDSCSITRDDTVETLETATMQMLDDPGEMYVRAYLVAEQGSLSETVALGTFLTQTSETSGDGKSRTAKLQCYSPLKELKDDCPPIGWYAGNGSVITDAVDAIMAAHCRAPYTSTRLSKRLQSSYVAGSGDTWLSVVKGLLGKAGMHLEISPEGIVSAVMDRDAASMQPSWTFDDGNSSIMLPDVTVTSDLSGIPNRYEAVYSGSSGSVVGVAQNDDPSSQVSTVSRGRIVLLRETNPSGLVSSDSDKQAVPSKATADAFARRTLRAKSCLESTVEIEHAYCGTRVGDCVRVSTERYGGIDIIGRVSSQTLDCVTGMTVKSKVKYTTEMWNG